jgi:hypothetical protein
LAVISLFYFPVTIFELQFFIENFTENMVTVSEI